MGDSFTDFLTVIGLITMFMLAGMLLLVYGVEFNKNFVHIDDVVFCEDNGMKIIAPHECGTIRNGKITERCEITKRDGQQLLDCSGGGG